MNEMRQSPELIKSKYYNINDSNLIILLIHLNFLLFELI